MFGSGIWLWENGLKTLKLLGAAEVLGAYEQAVHRTVKIREWRIANGEGKVIFTKVIEGRDRLLLPPRADLYRAQKL